MLVLPLGQVLDLALVNVDERLLGELKLLRLAVLQLLDFLRVLDLEFGLDIVVGTEHTVHVLLSLLLGVEQAELSAIDLVF